MGWAARRRFVILLIVGAVVAALIAVTLIASFYKAPSCTDTIQNQGEAGIDCGGPCPYLCTALEEPPTVLFTQALPNGAGRTDVIAYVENKNADAAAKGVPYRLTLYGNDQALIQQVTGTLELPPGATVPVYLPGVNTGKQTVVAAFLSIDPSAVDWFTLSTDPRVVPSVSNTLLGGTKDAPRVSAELANPTVAPLTDTKVVVVLRDGAGNVIGVSQTILPVIPAQGKATATFTWNAGFPGIPVSIEALPVVPLP